MKDKLKETIADIFTYLFKCERRTLLWTNPNPDTSWQGQSIPLPVSEYDYVEVWFHERPSGDVATPNVLKLPIGEIAYVAWFHQLGDNSGNHNAGTRYVSVSASEVAISNYTYKNYVSGTSLITDNLYCTPYRIYGIKVGGGYSIANLFQGLQRFSHRSCLGVM